MNEQLPMQQHDNNDATRSIESTRGSARQRRFAILGVTAGLLGGGAIGLLAAAPSFSSAASITVTDPTTPEPTATEPTTTEPTTTVAPTDATDPADRPDPSARIRESLQTLVDDGTITAEQADAVSAHLGSLRVGDHGGGRGGVGRNGGANVDAIAELIGIDAADVRIALEGGSTVAALAETNGVPVQTVIDGLVAAASARIDAAVADGSMSEDDAAAKRADLVTRITESVNSVRPAGGERGNGQRPGGNRGPGGAPDDAGASATTATDATAATTG